MAESITTLSVLSELPEGSLVRNTPPANYDGSGALYLVGWVNGGRTFIRTNGTRENAVELLYYSPIVVEYRNEAGR